MPFFHVYNNVFMITVKDKPLKHKPWYVLNSFFFPPPTDSFDHGFTSPTFTSQMEGTHCPGTGQRGQVR